MNDDVVFVVNPASANGSTRRRWPEIAHRAAELGLTGRSLLSEHPGQIAELARSASEDGAKLVVVVGGDGTVNEAANGLMQVEPEKRAELATIPRGTGKDFARSFGIPRNIEGALQAAHAGTTRVVDVGRASFQAWDGSPAESYFTNFAGAGISGAVAARANTSSKALGGRVSFFWATSTVFLRWRNSRESRWRSTTSVAPGRCSRSSRPSAASFAGGMRLYPEGAPILRTGSSTWR